MGFIIVLILIIFAIDTYAYQAVTTAFNDPGLNRTIALWVFFGLSLLFYLSTIAIVITLVAGDFSSHKLLNSILIGIIISIGIGKLLILPFLVFDDVFRFGKWMTSLFQSNPSSEITKEGISRAKFLSQLGLIAGGTTMGLFVWGMIRTAYNYTVRRETVILPHLPNSFNGLKIVQISDLHLGSFINTDPITKAVTIINDLNPDIVFFTGDMVNASSKEAEPFVDALSKIKAQYGVYSSLGNHDYGYYDRRMTKEQAIADVEHLKSIHAKCGWTLLNNENRVLDIDNTKVAIIGVENWGHSEHFPKRGDLDLASKGTEDADVKLLLSHDPSHWDYVVSKNYTDIDVTFSGHTHGAQMGVEIPWLKLKWSPSQYMYRQWAGLYKNAKQHLYVNRGLGFIGYNGRVGIKPEITLLTIASESKEVS